jgi:hypothetical protein
MPTVGWIQETAIDNYWEQGRIEWDALEPPIVYCPFCKVSFEDHLLLENHIGSVHPLDRPVITINSRRTESIIVIRNQQDNNSLMIHNSTHAFVKKNGGPVQEKSNQELVEEFEMETDAHYQFELINSRSQDGLSTSANYEISVCIPHDSDLDEIDQSFIRYIAKEDLTTSDIRLFADSCATFRVPQDYVDALTEYSFGTLIREGIGGVTLPFKEYKNKYQKSAAILSSYDRPIANAIRNCVRLALNEFSERIIPSGIQELDNSLVYFKRISAGVSLSQEALEVTTGTKHVLCPIDGVLLDILKCVSSLGSTNNVSLPIEQLVSERMESALLSEHDRAKFQVIFVSFLSDKSRSNQAKKQLRLLANDSVFGKWAERLLEQKGEIWRTK